MNISEIFSTEEIIKINNIGIKLENKNYTPTEYRLIESEIESYIMGYSTKNGEISRLSNEFQNILTKLINLQKS